MSSTVKSQTGQRERNYRWQMVRRAEGWQWSGYGVCRGEWDRESVISLCPRSHMHNGYCVCLPTVKADIAYLWPTTTSSSAKVKERAQLYLCSSTGPSRPVRRWTFGGNAFNQTKAPPILLTHISLPSAEKKAKIFEYRRISCAFSNNSLLVLPSP